MKKPWENKTGLAKWITIFATLTLFSLGSLRVNWAGISGLGMLPERASYAFGGLLTITGILECIGIAVGLIGLILAILIESVKERRR